MTNARRFNHDEIRAIAAIDGPAAAAREVGCSEGYARLIASGQIGGGHNATNSRKAPVPLMGRSSRGMPPVDHPAIMGARTIYPSTVVDPAAIAQAMLKSGHNNAKIGKRISKGRWKGFEVYTLTLEERATCPKSCHHWRSCFGNGMQQAQRLAHGPALEARLREEVRTLARRHPRGFAIRLHTLGDFYSVEYVALWAALLDEFPQLHAFGFSARWNSGQDPVAAALVDLVSKRWMRFAIRFSNAPVDGCSTVSIEHQFQKPDDALLCPQQFGKTDSCSTCALCWQTSRRIAFVKH